VRARSLVKKVILVKEASAASLYDVSGSVPLHEVAWKFSNNGFVTLVSVGSLIANGIVTPAHVIEVPSNLAISTRIYSKVYHFVLSVDMLL
jgi:hypothetical protein